MKVDQLKEMTCGDVVVDQDDVEWRKTDYKYWERVDGAGFGVLNSEELLALGPLTIGCRQRLELTGRDPAWGPYEDASSTITLLLMSDGTVRWEKE